MTQADEDVAPELERLMSEWQTAFGPAKRRDVLERIHHPRFVWTGADGTRMDRETHIRSELESDITNDLTEFDVTHYGDCAVAVGRLKLDGTFRAEGVDEQTVGQVNDAVAATGSAGIAFTITWIREEIGWQVAAIHLGLVGA